MPSTSTRPRVDLRLQEAAQPVERAGSAAGGGGGGGGTGAARAITGMCAGGAASIASYSASEACVQPER